MNKKPEMEIKSITETPAGHPDFVLDDNYLDKIDNMFANKNSNNNCIICLGNKSPIQEKYCICDICLKNEILSQLKQDYSNYLRKGNFQNKYKIPQIQINKYILYLKDTIDLLTKFIKIKNEKDIVNYLKQFVCIKCFKIVDGNKNNYANLPCGCRICNKEELENYFTSQNILSDNFICICGSKYMPKDLYDLSI